MTDHAAPSRERLTELFLMLTRLPSPSGDERLVADAVTSFLHGLGVDVEEDGAGVAGSGNTGNLRCTVYGVGPSPHVVLGAHLDTVTPTDSIEPVLDEEGVFRNERDTILGGDDKGAIAAMLHATEILKGSGEPFPSYELFFSVSEEQGLLGIKLMAEDAFRSPLAIVLDSSGPVGGMVVRAPSMRTFRATFRGKAAHAGVEPERGRSAIQAAGRAIAAMELGRLDSETSANVGVIQGGVATNIVPETCTLKGECRGHDEERLAGVAARMIEVIHNAAATTDVDVEVDLVNEFPAFSLAESSPVVGLGKAAVAGLGLEPCLLTAGGGSDANILNSRGLPTVNLSIGMMRAHSPDEHLSLDDLERLCGAILGVIRLAPQFAPRPRLGEGEGS